MPVKQRTKIALILVGVGVALNLALAFIKLFVGIRTNSLCIMLDSMNGFFDAATAVITVVAFALCTAPRSAKYPYGRGRGEYVAGFIVSVTATVMSVLFLMDSINRIAMPEPVWFGLQSCILISIGIPIKLAMAIIYGRFGKKLKSKALKAISTDCFLDVGITAATVISFTLSAKVNYAIDAIIGIVISAIIFLASVKMIVDNLGILSGANNCEEEKQALINACRENPTITKVLSIKLHDYGYRACVGNATVEFKEGTDEDEKLAAATAISEKLKEDYGAEITIIL